MEQSAGAYLVGLFLSSSRETNRSNDRVAARLVFLACIASLHQIGILTWFGEGKKLNL